MHGCRRMPRVAYSIYTTIAHLVSPFPLSIVSSWRLSPLCTLKRESVKDIPNEMSDDFVWLGRAGPNYFIPAAQKRRVHAKSMWGRHGFSLNELAGVGVYMYLVLCMSLQEQVYWYGFPFSVCNRRILDSENTEMRRRPNAVLGGMMDWGRKKARYEAAMHGELLWQYSVLLPTTKPRDRATLCCLVAGRKEEASVIIHVDDAAAPTPSDARSVGLAFGEGQRMARWFRQCYTHSPLRAEAQELVRSQPALPKGWTSLALRLVAVRLLWTCFFGWWAYNAVPGP